MSISNEAMRNRKNAVKTRSVLAAAVLASVSLTGAANAAVVKTFSAASGNYNTAGNWSPSGVPVSGDAAVIGSNNVTLDFSPVLSDIGATPALEISSGGTLNVASSSRTISSTGTATFTNAE